MRCVRRNPNKLGWYISHSTYLKMLYGVARYILVVTWFYGSNGCAHEPQVDLWNDLRFGKDSIFFRALAKQNSSSNVYKVRTEKGLLFDAMAKIYVDSKATASFFK
jgi:hypothetical protein